MSYWSVPRDWEGETVAIIGCGPSLQHVDPGKLLAFRRAIAINDALLRAPWADLHYFCDQQWWESNLYTMHGFPVLRVTMENDIPGVLRLRNTGPTGLETDPTGLRHGSNSGYQAINLAYHFGAKRIVLFGFDMRVVHDRTHWRERNGEMATARFQRTLTNTMLPKFQTLVEPLREAGVEVLNATPGSALTCWPSVSIDDILEARIAC